MAELGEDFDATGVEPQQAFEPLPPGMYKAMIVESEKSDTKAGDGSYIKLQWKVLEGEFANRVVFQNINLVNPNPKAVEIAKQQLSAICHATGKLRITDSQELHDVPVIIKIKIRPAKGDYGASNDVAGVQSVEAATAAASGSPAPAAPSAPAATKPATTATAGKPAAKKMPWQK